MKIFSQKMYHFCNGVQKMTALQIFFAPNGHLRIEEKHIFNKVLFFFFLIIENNN